MIKGAATVAIYATYSGGFGRFEAGSPHARPDTWPGIFCERAGADPSDRGSSVGRHKGMGRYPARLINGLLNGGAMQGSRPGPAPPARLSTESTAGRGASLLEPLCRNTVGTVLTWRRFRLLSAAIRLHRHRALTRSGPLAACLAQRGSSECDGGPKAAILNALSTGL
jgi:hypothetical protein